MEYSPLVTIITPTYNHEKFIGQCIDSVISQTYPNWEQIIIDDGSTDNTGKIIKKYQDDRIKYLKQENIGIWRLKESYNKALKMAKGELIAVLEGDDYWPIDKLEKQVSVFKDKEVVLSWGKRTIVNEENKILFCSSIRVDWFKYNTNEAILKKLIFNNFISACTVMCRKDALLLIGGFQQSQYTPYVDYPTWLKLCLVGKFKPINEILGYWRIHKNQVTYNKNEEIINAYIPFILNFYNNLPEPIKNNLKITEKDFNRAHLFNLSQFHFQKGIFNLLEKQWYDARKYFYSSFNHGSITIKIKSIGGLICSYFKIDIEVFAQLFFKAFPVHW